MNEIPVATAGMLIRKPVAEVFEAFVDPAITARFWFTRGSDRLDAGRPVRWEWEMYGVTVDVEVRELEPSRRIVIDWSSGGEPATTVTWVFRELSSGTLVSVENRGFAGDDDAVVRQALDATGGFTLVLAGAKAWLEHGIELGLVRDRFPAEL
jgi:uncharacterized protein YndB with AHSA1/START domain